MNKKLKKLSSIKVNVKMMSLPITLKAVFGGSRILKPGSVCDV